VGIILDLRRNRKRGGFGKKKGGGGSDGLSGVDLNEVGRGFIFERKKLGGGFSPTKVPQSGGGRYWKRSKDRDDKCQMKGSRKIRMVRGRATNHQP